MKKTAATLFSSAGIYTVANILNSAIPFLLLPVFTYYLKPSDYGIVATFQILIGFIAPFAGLSLYGAIAVKYYKNDEVNLPEYIANCIAILLVSTALVGIVLWLFSDSISNLTSFPKQWLGSIIIVSICQFIVQIALTLWQIQKKPVHYGTFQIIQTIFNISLSLIFIVGLEMHWQGRLWAQICSDIIFCIIALTILYKGNWIKFGYNKRYINSALRYGIPLIPHSLAGWAMSAVDRVFITKMVGLSDMGIYTVGYQIAMVVTLVQTSFNNAWVPWLFDKLKHDDFDDKIKIVKITYAYFAMMLIFTLVLSFSAPIFIKCALGKSFQSSIKYILWIALGKGLYSMYFMTCNYIFYTTKTKLIALSTFISALVHIVASYLLIKLNGAIGAAQAGIISTLVLVCLTWYFANYLYPMPWNLQTKKHNIH